MEEELALAAHREIALQLGHSTVAGDVAQLQRPVSADVERFRKAGPAPCRDARSRTCRGRSRPSLRSCSWRAWSGAPRPTRTSRGEARNRPTGPSAETRSSRIESRPKRLPALRVRAAQRRGSTSQHTCHSAIAALLDDRLPGRRNPPRFRAGRSRRPGRYRSPSRTRPPPRSAPAPSRPRSCTWRRCRRRSSSRRRRCRGRHGRRRRVHERVVLGHQLRQALHVAGVDRRDELVHQAKRVVISGHRFSLPPHGRFGSGGCSMSLIFATNAASSGLVPSSAARNAGRSRRARRRSGRAARRRSRRAWAPKRSRRVSGARGRQEAFLFHELQGRPWPARRAGRTAGVGPGVLGGKASSFGPDLLPVRLIFLRLQVLFVRKASSHQDEGPETTVDSAQNAPTSAL